MYFSLHYPLWYYNKYEYVIKRAFEINYKHSIRFVRPKRRTSVVRDLNIAKRLSTDKTSESFLA